MSGLRDAWLLGSERGARVLSEQMCKLRSGFVFFKKLQIRQIPSKYWPLPEIYAAKQHGNVRRPPKRMDISYSNISVAQQKHSQATAYNPPFSSISKNCLICRSCSHETWRFWMDFPWFSMLGSFQTFGATIRGAQGETLGLSRTSPRGTREAHGPSLRWQKEPGRNGQCPTDLRSKSETRWQLKSLLKSLLKSVIICYLFFCL